MKYSWRTEWPLWLILAAMFLIAVLAWNAVPDQIPVHWGLRGEPDRMGGRFEGLFILPLVSLFIYGVLRIAPRIDPARANYDAFAGAYATVRIIVLAALLAVQIVTVLAALGRPVNISGVIPLILGVLFVGLGNVLGKLRPNWFIGIRTPWTLSSRRSWDRTHQVGGWVFLVFGVLLMAAALARETWMLVTVFSLFGVGMIGLVVYSYLEWKQDPEKTPPSSERP